MKLLDFCKLNYQASISEKDKFACAKYWEEIFEKIFFCLNSNSFTNNGKKNFDMFDSEFKFQLRLLSQHQGDINSAFECTDIDKIHEEIKQVWTKIEEVLQSISKCFDYIGKPFLFYEVNDKLHPSDICLIFYKKVNQGLNYDVANQINRSDSQHLDRCVARPVHQQISNIRLKLQEKLKSERF